MRCSFARLDGELLWVRWRTVPNATRERACHATGIVHDTSCGIDEVGTPPNCTPCSVAEVPNSAGTACEACPTGQTETTRGTCSESGTAGGHGHCTSRGAYFPGDESGCVAAGRVLSNGQCPRTRCPANSTDNGGGVCDCDPGYVYTVATGSHYGPASCTARTAARCSAVADPGTCGNGGTWNSGTATCDCADGYEQSGNGQACVCAERLADAGSPAERSAPQPAVAVRRPAGRVRQYHDGQPDLPSSRHRRARRARGLSPTTTSGLAGGCRSPRNSTSTATS